MDGSHHCNEVKEILTNEGIEYVEADINENEEEYNLFVKVTDNEYVPAMMIIEDGTTDAKFYAPDRDFEDLDQAVNLIKESF